jgi:NAD(P)-dependent dehydrogenase (short-subunit alcohol dehydrogenase family)
MAYLIDLKGQVALVTGGVQGIGLAIAKVLAQAGARIAVCDILPEENEITRQGLAEIARATDVYPLFINKDLSDENDCKKMVDMVIETCHRLDIIVFNAAVVGKGGKWDLAFRVNVKCLYCTANYAKPFLEKTKGRIIIMTSASIFTGGTEIPEYIATKGGTYAMVRFLARECAKIGIRVNGIAPAVIMTDMTLTRFGNAENMLKHYEGKLPMNRIGTVENVADTVLYLASDMSSWMCGETLLLDGGRLYLQ